MPNSKQPTSPVGPSVAATAVGPYVLGDTLGEGSYGKVKLGQHRETGHRVAVKILSKTLLMKNAKTLQRTQREISVMRIVRHPCITELIDVLQTEANVYLVLEYMQGGDLLHYLWKHGAKGLPYEKAFKFFYQILSGLEYCHCCCVCHRDIKPENVLLTEDGTTVKLADFGMANLSDNQEFMQTACGSPHYAAPEIVRGEQYDGMRADVWSFGVLTYGMFAGRLPFNDSNTHKLLAKVAAGQFRPLTDFDSELIDILNRMICVDVKKRYTIAQIKEHPFWRNNCRKYNLDPSGLHLPRSADHGDKQSMAIRQQLAGFSDPSGPPPVPTKEKEKAETKVPTKEKEKVETKSPHNEKPAPVAPAPSAPAPAATSTAETRSPTSTDRRASAPSFNQPPPVSNERRMTMQSPTPGSIVSVGTRVNRQGIPAKKKEDIHYDTVPVPVGLLSTATVRLGGRTHNLLMLQPTDLTEVSELQKILEELQAMTLQLERERETLRTAPQSALLPYQLQQPLTGSLDDEIVSFIMDTQRWVDRGALESALHAPEPQLVKAFYRLLVTEKQTRGTLAPLAQSMVITTPQNVFSRPASALANARGRSDGDLLTSTSGLPATRSTTKRGSIMRRILG